MPTCPAGHESASSDFCDNCGMRIGGATSASAAAPASAPLPASPSSPSAPSAPASSAEPCPQCSTARTGQFCEACGFDFASGRPLSTSVPAPAGPAPASAANSASSGLTSPSPASSGLTSSGLTSPGSPSSGLTSSGPSSSQVTSSPSTSSGMASSGMASSGVTSSGGTSSGVTGATGSPAADVRPGGDGGATPAAAAAWTAVVTADRDYFDAVVAANGPDAATLEFPGYCPERRFRLSGAEMRIGRRSVSRGLQPEIDLTGPPADTGVSHLHAVLLAQPDGSWAIVDPGSANGTKLNEQDLSIGVRTALHDGDRICLGAWTKLTILSG